MYSFLLKKKNVVTGEHYRHHHRTSHMLSELTWNMAPVVDTTAVVHMHMRTYVASVPDIPFILSIGLQRAGLRMALCSLNLKDVVEVC